ncbi:hypothetical protein OESDEN_03158 [Oesophagostomum dentatum]|uniref:SCP domain-containing protein n=1 Tax=Oesophagostomum dentatum TaxID=61180 RepID=A0A0B1TH26_OESDE|nr:hypothetical protein OESDEN_03158 [Oesophagostomum dentatum]
MAWAATYKVGCGINRCETGTVIVCHYRPRVSDSDVISWQPLDGKICVLMLVLL